MQRIIAFAGSNHSESINSALVQYVAKQLREAEVEVLDLREFEVPMYSIDSENNNGIPERIHDLKKIFRHADGFVIASPEHNGSIPAFFKNIIDWLSRIEQNIFDQKPVLLLSASPGARGGKTNLEHLAQLMPYWGAEIIDHYSIGNFNQYYSEKHKKLLPEIELRLHDGIQILLKKTIKNNFEEAS